MISSPNIIEKIFRYDVSLEEYTSFGTGGMAEIFVEPDDVSSLQKVLQFCKCEQKKVFVFGKGTNILVNDSGVKGVVIHLGGKRFNEIERNGVCVSSGAGVSLPRLVRKTALYGLKGLEVLAGIPGSVGGAVMMNAGGKYGEIGERIRSLTTITLDGEIIKHSREDVKFAYRECGLRNQIILNVEFILEESKIEEILETRDEIYREKKERQPLSERSAGCIFKNTDNIAAAELIDKAGLKGKRVGGAVVSEKHANFIVNTEDATSADILELMEIVREIVREKYSVLLESEIKIW